MPVLDRPDVRLNYQVMAPRGAAVEDRLPVVMIHGLGANHAFWYVVAMRHLSQDRTLLLPDLRGHGRSSMPPDGYGLDQMARDMLATMDAAGMERAHLVGHSHGARVALLLAMEAPERFASLTVADTQLRALQPPMRLGDWPHWPEWKADLTAQGVTSFPPEDAQIDFRLLSDLGQRGKAALASGDGTERGEGAEMGPVRRRIAEARAERGAAPRRRAGINLRSRQMGRRGGQQWTALIESTTAGTEMHDETPIDVARLGDLPMPVMLAYGAKSHCLPTSEILMDRIPGARRIVVPEAGHFFPIVKPRFFALALRTFLAGIETPGRAHRRRETARRTGRPVLRGTLLRRRKGLRT